MANINTRRESIAMQYMNRTAGILRNATGEYIREVMPNVTSTASGINDTLRVFQKNIPNTTIIPKIRQMGMQQSIRNINRWFLQKEDSYGDIDQELSFDTDVDNLDDIGLSQLNSDEKNSREISKTVVETSHKMVEAQLSTTANILSSIDRIGATITSGFDNINNTLTKLLEVTTKNTATLIEATIATSGEKDTDLSSGKFDINEYKKMVSKNIENSELGLATSMLSMLQGGGAEMLLSPQNIIGAGAKALLNKKSPNLKKNMEALDTAIGDLLMGSLVRLGEKSSDFGPMGMIGKIFGINGDRKDISTKRSSIGVKAVPYDSISKEALTSAIPGYLRQILVQLGGPDTVYDYRSRSFRTQTSIAKEFRDVSTDKNLYHNAGSNVKKIIGSNYNNDEFRNMMYDLMMNDLSTNTRYARNTISSFKSDPRQTESYLGNLIKNSNNYNIANANSGDFKTLVNSLSNLDGYAQNELINQLVMSNRSRTSRMNRYVSEADKMGVDLSFISDSSSADKDNILNYYTKPNSSISSRSLTGSSRLLGTDYTNAALYEIYRRLNTGINVFKVGEETDFSKIKRSRFKANNRLKTPNLYKPSNDMDIEEGGIRQPLVSTIRKPDSDKEHTNHLMETEDDDGNELTKTQRLQKWAKSSGGNIFEAMFSGTPEDVQVAFSQAVGDIAQLAGRPIKSFLLGDSESGKEGLFSKINDSFGNVTGFMKHKFMGTEYEYTDDKGQRVRVNKNEKGGVVGYLKDNVASMFKGTGDTTKKWFSDVIKYFDFRGDGDEDKSVENKRKSLIGASIGAMGGLGFLGGPMGLIFGAVAGNALSMTGIGTKMKEFLFGKDYKDKKGNDKHKLGLFERAVNGVIDPIRFQLGKTFSTAKDVLKRNILGPLSDIGFAIKERMANAAGGVVSTAFGKIFGGMGGILKKLILDIPLSIARAPIAAVGALTRGGMRTGGKAAGATMGGLANLIAGKQNRDKLDARREEREDTYDDDTEYNRVGGLKGFFGGNYKEWKRSQDEQRRNRPGLEEYIADGQKEIIDINEKVEENTSRISRDINKLTEEATTPGSLYVHDYGIHERLDTLIHMINGTGIITPTPTITPNITKDHRQSDESSQFANSMAMTAAQLAALGGIDDNDERDVSSIVDEASRGRSSKNSIVNKFKSILKRNKEDDKSKSDDEGKKEEGFFSKLFNGITGLFTNGGTLSKLLLGGAGILALSNEKIRTFLTETVWPGFRDYIIKPAGQLLADILGNLGGSAVDWLLDRDGSSGEPILDEDGNIVYNQNGDVVTTSSSISYDKNGNIERDENGNVITAGETKQGRTGFNLSNLGYAGNKVNEYGSKVTKSLFGENMDAFRTGAVTKNVSNVFSGLKLTGRLAGSQALSGASNLIGKVATSSTGVVSKVTGAVGSKLGSASSALLKGSAKAASKISAVLGFVIDGIIGFFRSGEIFDKDRTDVDGLNQFSAFWGNFLGGAGDGIIADICNGNFNFGTVIGSLGNIAKWAIAGAVIGAPFFGVGAIPGAIVGAIIGIITSLIGGDTLARGMDSVLRAIGNTATGVAKGISKLLGGVDDEYGGSGRGLWDTVSSGVSNFFGSIKSKADAAVNAIKRFTGNALKIWNIISTTKVNSIDDILEAIIKIDEAVSGAGKGNGSNIRSKTPSLLSGRGDIMTPREYGSNPYFQGGYSNMLNMNDSGCGPIAAAFMTNVYGSNISPIEAASLLQGTDYRDSSGATTASGIEAVGRSAGIPMVSGPPTAEGVIDRLASGEPVTFLGQSDNPNSPYTESGHFVVGSSMDSSGNVEVMDPLSNTPKHHKVQTLLNEADSVTYADGMGRGRGRGRGRRALLGSGSTALSSSVTNIGKMGRGPNSLAASTGTSSGKLSNLQQAIVDTALSFVGRVPNYSMDSNKRMAFMNGGNSADCSGFTYGIFYMVTGENIGQNSGQQYTGKFGKVISGSFDTVISQLQPGDLIFLKNTYNSPHADGVSHVEIYLGNNEMVHIGSTSSGGVVKVKLRDYDRKHFLCGKRMIQGNDLISTSGNQRVSNINRVDGSSLSGSNDYTSSSNSFDFSNINSREDIRAYLEQDITDKSEGSFMKNGWSILKNAGKLVAGKFGDIFGFNSNSSSSSSTLSSVGTTDDGDFTGGELSGSNNVEKAYNYFISKGASPQTAAAIIGNLQQESGVDPTKKQYGGGPGRGLAQWEVGGRFDLLESFAKERGKDWTDLPTQLDYMWKELSAKDNNNRMKGKYADASQEYKDIFEKNLNNKGAYGLSDGFDEFKKLTDIDFATRMYEAAFTRAGKPMMTNRINYANQAYSKFGSRLSQSSSITSNISDIYSASGRGRGPKLSKQPLNGSAKGKGGDAEENINISSSINKDNNILGRGNGISSGITEFTPTTSNTSDINAFSSNNINVLSNYKEMETILSALLAEIRSINMNTSNAATSLVSIDNKTFDANSTKSPKSSSRSASSMSRPFTHSQGNATSVRSIVNPR